MLVCFRNARLLWACVDQAFVVDGVLDAERPTCMFGSFLQLKSGLVTVFGLGIILLLLLLLLRLVVRLVVVLQVAQD